MASSATPLAPPSPSGSQASATGTREFGTTRHGVCAFVVPSGKFAIDVRLIGEIVSVEHARPVPLAPAGVLGMFNLRGVPVALVDMTTVLDMPADLAPARADPIAVVLLGGNGALAALLVQSVIGILPPAAGTFTASERAIDHPTILGFLATAAHGVLSILDGPAVTQRLARLYAR